MNKSPPLLSKTKSYDDWLKLIEVWRQFTTLEPEKQGPAVVLTLEGEAQDAVLELQTTELTGKDGIDKIINRLNKIYKKDEFFNTKVQCFRSIRNLQTQIYLLHQRLPHRV